MFIPAQEPTGMSPNTCSPGNWDTLSRVPGFVGAGIKETESL